MTEAVHDAQRLAELQAFPLERKIQITQTRIIEWYQHYNGNVVVSFSGGKDSTMLLKSGTIQSDSKNYKEESKWECQS